MVLGIYCYIDKKDDSIVYIGKDSNIDKEVRHKSHFTPSSYNYQQINRVLQNNPNRYNYKVLEWNVTSQEELNILEISYIEKYNPRFNFTNGGDGIIGFKFSKESKIKMSKSQMGNKNALGKKKSNCAKRKISNALKGRTFSNDQKRTFSKIKNSSGYYRVCKQKDKSCSQGFIWCYQYYDENNIRKKIRAVNLKKLEEKVKDKELEWYFFGDDNG